MISASEASKYLLTLDDQEAGDLMSNLKLQKLLYYAQGVALALRDGGPLFREPIEAWQHGPVCPSVYREYRECGASPLPRPTEFDPRSIPTEDREVLDEVHTVYGQFSAWRLREMTHETPPWRDYFREGEFHIEIPHDAMRAYFSTLVTRG